MNPKQASLACDEANRLGLVGKYTLSGIIEKVGPRSAAQYDVWRAAQFKPNSTNSKQPNADPSQIPDKQYPISNYAAKSDCINQLLALDLDQDVADRECSSIFGPGSGTKGGKGWTTPQIEYKSNAPAMRGEGKRLTVSASIKSASEKINAETKAYYSRPTNNVRNANVSNSSTIPSWIVASGVDTSHLMNTSITNNLKGAALDEHQIYMYQLHRSMSNHPDSVNHVAGDAELDKRVYEKGQRLAREAESRSIRSGAVEKKDKYGGKPYWAYLAGF